MNTEPIISLAEQLIKIPSISGDKEKAIAIIELVKKQLPDAHFTAYAKDGISSLLYSNRKNEKDFKVILNVHLDVVPAAKEQFVPFIKDNKLYGRGAYDMKAAAAVCILLFKELAPKIGYPLGLQITTDEETGGIGGTAYQLEKGIRSEFMVTGECGSNFDIVYESKGMTHIKLVAHGKTSHSAYPWLGENAIMKMYEAIKNIHTSYPEQKDPTFKTTVNVLHITTNNTSKHTITPDHCEAMLDIRYVPTEKNTIIKKIESLLPEGVTMEIILHTVPHETKKNNKYVTKLKTIAGEILQREVVLKQQHATSDARYYSLVNCDAVEFGPIGSGQHQDNEWVDRESIGQFHTILKTFLLSLDQR